jgi:hypothetical protein
MFLRSEVFLNKYDYVWAADQIGFILPGMNQNKLFQQFLMQVTNIPNLIEIRSVVLELADSCRPTDTLSFCAKYE